jgi:DNA sulfur modification protein DndD
MTEKFRKALDDGQCTTCGQELSEDAKTRLTTLISDAFPKDERAQMEAMIQQLESRIAALKQSEASSNADVLQEVQNTIDELKIKKATDEDRLIDIREQTKDLDEAVVRRLYSEYEKTLTDIGILQSGIKKQEEALKDINESIGKVELEIAKFADTDLDTARARKELCEKLKSLFSGSVDAYRDRLRGKVEKDATALFLKLTSEPEYRALSINDSYGLTIVHQDGTTIPVRSAGAEHIVALSLMGALQKNAPLRGPIVMDSPFGRLDQAHTTKVIQALPSMADQVLLLVYESELDPQQVRDELRGKLRKEYRIARRSARHSTLETMS